MDTATLEIPEPIPSHASESRQVFFLLQIGFALDVIIMGDVAFFGFGLMRFKLVAAKRSGVRGEADTAGGKVSSFLTEGI